MRRLPSAIGACVLGLSTLSSPGVAAGGAQPWRVRFQPPLSSGTKVNGPLQGDPPFITLLGLGVEVPLSAHLAIDGAAALGVPPFKGSPPRPFDLRARLALRPGEGAREPGWEVAGLALAGLRLLRRIDSDDFGSCRETSLGATAEVGLDVTWWSSRGFGISWRVLAGGTLPLTSSGGGSGGGPPPHYAWPATCSTRFDAMDYGLHAGLDIGVAF